ncbi:MAG TPA: hypothetical protein VEJ18_03195 [Planctomycetota bacterium]|nr:hypothetical protein [Planctomycetota bacterium]
MPPSPAPEDRSPVVASLVILFADVFGYGAFAVHTVLSRRRYRPVLDDPMFEPSTAVELFVGLPAPVYAAAFILFAIGLLMKEVAVERRGVTLRVNVLALVGLAALWWAWSTAVVAPLEAWILGSKT